MGRQKVRTASSRRKPTTQSCSRCNALCCRYFALNIDTPTTREEFENIRWFLLHKDCEIWVQDGDWYLQVNRPCKALASDNRCTIYENRPSICRKYKTDTCDRYGDDYEYEHRFTEPEQIAAFARAFLAKQRRRRVADRRDRKQSTPTPRQTARSRRVGTRRLLKSA